MVNSTTYHNNQPKIVRKKQLAEKIVIIDGQPGCGKTMLSPIVSSMERGELLSSAFEIEFICRLFHLNKIEPDAAISMVRMLVDHKLYQTMMGRETNFRYSDLSSVFNDSNPWRYFKRIFQKGDMEIPERIKNQKPILNLITHDLLSVSDPIIPAIGNEVLYIEELNCELDINFLTLILLIGRLLLNKKDRRSKIFPIRTPKNLGNLKPTPFLLNNFFLEIDTRSFMLRSGLSI